MGIIQQLKGKTVFLDTAPLIYYIEENPDYSGFLNKLFLLNSKGDLTFHASVITLLEVLVHPMRKNEHQLAKKYYNILCNSQGIDVFDMTVEVAKNAATLRAKYGVKTPGAILLGTAVSASSDYFITNDVRLKAVKEIKFLVLNELMKK